MPTGSTKRATIRLQKSKTDWARKDSAAGGARLFENVWKISIAFLEIYNIHMYGISENQADPNQGGERPMSLWRGRKTRRNLCSFCEAGTHRVSGSNRLAGIPFLHGGEDVKTA